MQLNLNADDALLEALSAKADGAAEVLVERYGGRIYGMALRMMGNPADAQEVAKEALLTIYNKAGGFERRSAFSSWIYRVTANAALMRLRKRKGQQDELSLETLQEPLGESSRILEDWRRIPSNETLNRELGKVIQNAVRVLPDEYRVVLVMKDMEGQSLEEIASALELTLAAAKTRLHRARMVVRKAVTDYLREGRRTTT
ncbi:MAG: sigma-70 family RNA polymerase sigma factor [Verrucomicrobiia bacterium]